MKKILIIGGNKYAEVLHSKLQEKAITYIDSVEDKQLNNRTMKAEREFSPIFPDMEKLLHQKKEHETFYSGTTKSQQIKRKVLAKRNKRK